MKLTPSEYVWLCLEDRAGKLPLHRTPQGGGCFEFRASPGLYQFSVIADARECNWDELYINLDLFGNKGQRTGPWDFNLLDGNKPLVPSYRVSLDGRKIGLWFFERVSLPDIEHRRFRGRMAFQIEREGQHTLEFIPYRAMPARLNAPFKLWIALSKSLSGAIPIRTPTVTTATWARRTPCAPWPGRGIRLAIISEQSGASG